VPCGSPEVAAQKSRTRYARMPTGNDNDGGGMQKMRRPASLIGLCAVSLTLPMLQGCGTANSASNDGSPATQSVSTSSNSPSSEVDDPASPTAEAPQATPNGQPFTCPSGDDIAAATGLPFAQRGADSCDYDIVVNDMPTTGIVALHPPVGGETLAQYKRDMQAIPGTVTSKPEYGPGAFEYFSGPGAGSLCTMWKISGDGQVTSIQANYFTGPNSDVCAIVQKAAPVFP
jgi:hypothetical protein